MTPTEASAVMGVLRYAPANTSGIDFRLMGRLRPLSSPRPPSRGPASVLAAASAAEPVLHRRRREPEMGPGSGAGATVGVALPSVPINNRWYNAAATQDEERGGAASFDTRLAPLLRMRFDTRLAPLLRMRRGMKAPDAAPSFLSNIGSPSRGPQSSPRPPSRGPASVLAADRGSGQAVRPVLHRLRHHRQPRLDPGSGAGVTRGALPFLLIPGSDRARECLPFLIPGNARVSGHLPFLILSSDHARECLSFLIPGSARASGRLPFLILSSGVSRVSRTRPEPVEGACPELAEGDGCTAFGPPVPRSEPPAP